MIRFMIPVTIKGEGYIEILAKSKEEALEKYNQGLGAQKSSYWEIDDIDLDGITDDGEVTDDEIEDYKKETGEDVG